MSAPAVAVSKKGKKFAVAWKDMRKGEPNIYWSISNAPQFSRESLLHQNTQGRQDHPSLCIDDNLTVWAVWEDDRAGSKQIWLRSSTEKTETCISGETDSPASYPVVAAGDGIVAATYELGKGKDKEIRFQLIDREVTQSD